MCVMKTHCENILEKKDSFMFRSFGAVDGAFTAYFTTPQQEIREKPQISRRVAYNFKMLSFAAAFEKAAFPHLMHSSEQLSSHSMSAVRFLLVCR